MLKYGRSLIALVGLVILHGASTVRADFLQTRTFVPFDFTVGTTTLPAGRYLVSRLDGSAAVIQLRSSKAGVFLVTQETTSGNRVDHAAMVFHRYGERYFLRQIWVSGSRGFAMPESQAERELVNARNGVTTRVTVASAASR